MNNKENYQDNGLELLNKVIETNERNIEQGIKTEFLYEDLLNLKSETDSSLQGLNATNLKLVELLDNEKQERKIFLEKIPKTIEVKISEDSLNRLTEFEKKSNVVKYVIFGSIGVLLLSVLVIFMVSSFANKWYSESIRAKSELRQEIFSEFEKDGKKLYPKDNILQLENNTQLIQKWINKNPKDAEKFLRFKDGYDAR